MKLGGCWTASALGSGNEETLANYLHHVASGMREISGDIPSRSIYFGSVTAELPEIAENRWDMRTNRLLKAAVESSSIFSELVAKYGAKQVGIVLGASNTGIDEAQKTFFDEPSRFDFSMIELGTPSAYLKRLLGTEGPAYTVSTACSSSAKAFEAARRLVENGVCEAAIVGGVDGRCRFAMNGFHALGALSQGRCRPLAEDRDGINLGEGVALFTLEKGENGIRLASVGESSDAYHATAPDPEGMGAEAAMRSALERAGVDAAEVDYVNLHGTGTLANDAMEMKAVRRVFGERAKVESTKDLTGHCLGAAGAVEAAICWLLLNSGRYRVAISNSFAFGGSNASILLAR